MIRALFAANRTPPLCHRQYSGQKHLHRNCIFRYTAPVRSHIVGRSGGDRRTAQGRGGRRGLSYEALLNELVVYGGRATKNRSFGPMGRRNGCGAEMGGQLRPQEGVSGTMRIKSSLRQPPTSLPHSLPSQAADQSAF